MSARPPARSRRPEPDKALWTANRTGDQLVVTKLDRLGRSLEHLIRLSKQLHAKQVDPGVLDQGINTSTAVSRMFFQILEAIAEFAHALMSERTIDDLSAARARSRPGGQKPKLDPRQTQLARQMHDKLSDDLHHGWGTKRDTRAGRAVNREHDCSRQALAVLGLAATLRADGGTSLPEGVHQLCADITELRAAVRGEGS